MNESEKNLIKSGIAIAGTLVGYAIGKKSKKVDKIPALLIGGFVGQIIGSTVASEIKEKNS